MSNIQQSRSDLLFLIISVLVAIIGALGQASVLHNTLVHSYPFKLMGMPPADFYASTGNIGYYLSLSVSFVLIWFARNLKKFWVISIPVIACPLFYWMAFELGHLFMGYNGQLMLEQNFDSYTGVKAAHEFGYAVLWLIFSGAAIGFVVGFTVEIISKIGSRKLS